MVRRIDKSIICGWIDNRRPGVTLGAIQLLGFARPLEICLRGDCLRDIAGARLDFSNPNPQPQPELSEDELLPMQRGLVGEMTASKRVRRVLLSDAECQQYELDDREIPYEVANVLSLEWYSFVSGRVRVELRGAQMQVSRRAWMMDALGEREQKDRNRCMRDDCDLWHDGLDEQGAHWSTTDAGKYSEFLEQAEWYRRVKAQQDLALVAHQLGSSEQRENARLEEEGISMQALMALKHHVVELLGDAFLNEGAHEDLMTVTEHLVDSLGEVLTQRSSSMEVGAMEKVKGFLDEALAACQALCLEDGAFCQLIEQFELLRQAVVSRVSSP